MARESTRKSPEIRVDGLRRRSSRVLLAPRHFIYAGARYPPKSARGNSRTQNRLRPGRGAGMLAYATSRKEDERVARMLRRAEPFDDQVLRSRRPQASLPSPPTSE